MNANTWQVFNWPYVYWTTDRFDEMLRRMHLAGLNAGQDSADGCVRGSVLWALPGEEPAAGLLWEWVEVRPRVIAISDPMAIVSNIRIMEPGVEGEELPERILRLNRAVHGWAWQDAILRRLGRRRPVGAPRSRVAIPRPRSHGEHVARLAAP